jgi:hypothetical protein
MSGDLKKTADSSTIAAEALLPVAIRKHNHWFGIRCVVLDPKPAAERETWTEPAEKFSGHHAGDRYLGFRSCEGGSREGIRGRFDRRHFSAHPLDERVTQAEEDRPTGLPDRGGNLTAGRSRLGHPKQR